jgi:hypothetical protein
MLLFLSKVNKNAGWRRLLTFWKYQKVIFTILAELKSKKEKKEEEFFKNR